MTEGLDVLKSDFWKINKSDFLPGEAAALDPKENSISKLILIYVEVPFITESDNTPYFKLLLG
jgi:hypothetical protein